MGAGIRNLEHALTTCDDPDCEIHNPLAIEDDNERTTACAWYVAGMLRTVDLTTLKAEGLRNRVENMRDEAIAPDVP